MPIPACGLLQHSGKHRWETIRYALDSNARTARFCVIMLVASIPPETLIVLLIHR